jgi:hypothetical protein
LEDLCLEASSKFQPDWSCHLKVRCNLTTILINIRPNRIISKEMDRLANSSNPIALEDSFLRDPVKFTPQPAHEEALLNLPQTLLPTMPMRLARSLPTQSQEKELRLREPRGAPEPPCLERRCTSKRM